MSIEDLLAAPKIHVSDNALSHFNHLIAKEEISGMGLRIFLDHPGQPNADISIAFCPPGEHRGGDIQLTYPKFTLYIDRASVSFLEDAEIDYQQDKLGGQLVITAPNLHPKPTQEDSLSEKVNYILQTEINPNLASHGGMVSLVEITPSKEVVLQFGGGCHGCGMVDVTLKQGIEKTLMTQLPEITAVIDNTDHTQGENPYYD
ncbi:MAG: NifU family protein [Proteobacteria bacterium]|nr:NifU family protein [Pseudomonadota bacterium]